VAGNEGLSEPEKFVQRWLGDLTDYDALRGTQLVLTLAEYLDHDCRAEATAAALGVHRNTVKYRLRRIRELSGHDLGVPDTLFHLQLATRAWRTRQAAASTASGAGGPTDSGSSSGGSAGRQTRAGRT